MLIKRITTSSKFGGQLKQSQIIREKDVRAIICVPAYWKYAVGAHVLFFRRTTDGIEVVRVLHQRMDFERHL